jgi:hypothetical protein
LQKKELLQQRIRDLEAFKNKEFSPGITEKNTRYLSTPMSLGTKDSAQYTAWLNTNLDMR